MEPFWPIARRQGHVAGSNMTGARMICTREVSFNAIRVGGIMTATIGAVEQGGDPKFLTVASNERQSWRVCRQEGDVVHADPANRVRVLVGERTIVGAVVIEDQTLAYPLLQMIQDETDISSIRSSLVQHPQQGIEVIARFYKKG